MNVEKTNDVQFDSCGAAEVVADRGIWRLYESAFPADEREPPSVIITSLGSGTALVTRAQLNSATVGFAVTHLLRDPPVAFLVYLAVGQDLQGHGIGSRLFEQARNNAASWYAARAIVFDGVVWEIDIPSRADAEAEKARRLRRRSFFLRLGGSEIMGTYLQPAINGPSPVPMLLMYRAEPGRAVPERDALIQAIYFEKYGTANQLSTPLLQRLLNSIRQS